MFPEISNHIQKGKVLFYKIINEFRAKSNRKFFAAAALFLLAGTVSYITFLYFSLAPKLANADLSGVLPISTRILDRNGELLYEVGGETKREVVKASDISPIVKAATVAAEDKNFYEHIGLDPAGIGRAMIANIRAGGVVQGGSTITQQLVKNTLLTRDRTLERKLKEAILSLMVESRLSKDQILTAYLNSVSYGSNLVGISKASEVFFGKNPNELTLSEAATLAALPRSPGYLSPYNGNREALLERRNFILNIMRERDLIPAQEYAAAKNAEIKIKPFSQPMLAPHFSLLVREQLIKQYGREKVEEGGLVVQTTLDAKLQAETEKIVAQHRRRINGWGASNAGAIVTDPRTGEILAMVGSFDYFDSKIDGNVNITLAPRQPGSSFKPIVYSALFSFTNFSPASLVFDVKTNFGGGYIPENYSKKNYGVMPFRRALAGSLNIPAVKATSLVGVDKVVDMAENLGLSTLTNETYGLALGLGAGEVKLAEMASAFGTFANNGQFTPGTTVLSVKEFSGKEIYKFKPASRQAVPPEVAYQMNNILSDNSSRSFIFGAGSPLAFPGHTVGAKTGTTSWYKDAWTVGFTTSRVVGVWTGNNNGRIMRYGADGVFAAAPLWRQILMKSMEGQKFEEFPRPDGLRVVNGELLTAWQQVGGDVKLASRSERPDNPGWEKPVQEYLKKQQEEEAAKAAEEAARQAAAVPVLTPTGAGGGSEPDVGGAPEEETTPPPATTPPATTEQAAAPPA